MRITLAYPWQGNCAGDEIDVDDGVGRKLVHDGLAREVAGPVDDSPGIIPPPDFASMNVDELRQYADEHEIDIDRRLGKSHLVKLLTDATQPTEPPAGDQTQEN